MPTGRSTPPLSKPEVVEIVKFALIEHVEDEAEQLGRIDRVMTRLADAIDLLRWGFLVVFILVIGVAALNQINQLNQDRGREQLKELVCDLFDSPGTTLTACANHKGDAP